MEKEGNIVRYTDEEIKARIARGEDRTDWARVMAKTEEELDADMANDPAWDGVPEDWVSRGHPASGPPGPLKQNKRQVAMRFDADVLEYFKRQGRGWQGRMNAVLRGYVERDREKIGS